MENIMQTQYAIDNSDIIFPNIITFTEWQTLKQYGDLTKGFNAFSPEELDDICVFYDQDMVYLDYLERREVEEIHPDFVLVPRFFWEMHKDTIPEDFMPGLKAQERYELSRGNSREAWFTLESRLLAGEKPMPSSASPRDEQKPVIDFFTDQMQINKKIRGVLQAPPGAGKTFISINLLSGFRAKGLIVVPNEVLQDQWKDAILQFTDLSEDDIGLIQGSDLQKNQSEIEKPVCIVKIQSLFSQIKRNHIRDLMAFYRYKDMIFYDECHNSGAATSYAKTSSLFTTPNIIGLSATPYRVGVNDYLLKASIGETIYKLDHNNLTPDVEIHKVYVEFKEDENKRLRNVQHDYNMMLGIFGAIMKYKDEYFRYLADIVAWNHSQGHNVVVLFPTIALMEKLLANLEHRHPEVHSRSLLLKGKTKQDSMDMVKVERRVLMDEYKQFKADKDQKVKDKLLKRKEYQVIVKERRAEIDAKIAYLKEHALDVYKKKVVESDIIVSNYNLLSAGFDKPQLSNIIFGGAPRIGKISVIQSIGRITRKYDGKLKPLAQYFIPSPFFDINKSTGIILNKNIKLQYDEAEFKYAGFN